MTTVDSIGEKRVSDFFGFSQMDDEERIELLDSIGATIFESALIRFAADATPEEMETFQHYLEEHQDDENAFEQLAASFPKFATIVFEEAQIFRTEAAQFAEVSTSLSTV